jgi:hypothetical protein
LRTTLPHGAERDDAKDQRAAAIIGLIICLGIAAAEAAKKAPGCGAACSLDDATPMPAMTGMPGMTHDMGGMGSSAADSDMGPHMHMTQLQPMQPGDQARADAIVSALVPAIEKYRDYRVAEQDGFIPFHPEIRMQMYHFTNYANARRAQFTFDPTRPTPLLYAKTDDGYRLVGAMYTAPRSSTLAQLDARVPLSIARWHEHVDLCWGPRGPNTSNYIGPNARFGFKGSIATADACSAAGGIFTPIVFNWMVHVYPFEKDKADIWKVGM